MLPVFDLETLEGERVLDLVVKALRVPVPVCEGFEEIVGDEDVVEVATSEMEGEIEAVELLESVPNSELEGSPDSEEV